MIAREPHAFVQYPGGRFRDSCLKCGRVRLHPLHEGDRIATVTEAAQWDRVHAVRSGLRLIAMTLAPNDVLANGELNDATENTVRNIADGLLLVWDGLQTPSS